MPCTNPLTGYKAREINAASGKYSTVFNSRHGIPDEIRELPCGQCASCRVESSRQIALRAMHEASLYPNNCFLTLTYSPENLPKGYHLKSDPHHPNDWIFTPAPGSIDPRHPVEFVKRLREKFGTGIRTYGCAEYGSKLSRPHYHLLIFNFQFPTRFILPSTKNKKHKLFTSPELEKLWTLGHSSIGDLTFESAAYVARYCAKKIKISKKSPPSAVAHYERLNSETGEIYQILPERAVCVPRKVGLGKDWALKNSQFLKHHDFVVMRAKKMKPPKYYDRIFDLEGSEEFDMIKELRIKAGNKSKAALMAEDTKNYKPYVEGAPFRKCRLQVLEEIAEMNLKKLERKYENE